MAEPGWYRNPDGTGERWWDGKGWTTNTRTAPPTHPPQPAADTATPILIRHAAQAARTTRVAGFITGAVFTTGAGLGLFAGINENDPAVIWLSLGLILWWLLVMALTSAVAMIIDLLARQLHLATNRR